MTIADLGHEVLGDRYELQRVIATGGMGEVWRGRDTLFDRPVAVKVLRSEYADDPAYAARFRAEAQHAAALHHPNIAAVHDYGEASSDTTGEHLAYLVMELVEGEPLSARLAQEGSLPPAVALSVLQQASAALAEAHRAGVVHRDVKPANILVRPDGTVKLTDFGIARSATSVSLTGAGQVIGTPQYMSPEQAMGEPTGPASDVYALGLVGYECLTGRAAFSGDNPVTIALKQVQQTPDPLPADLPADVRTLVDAALAKDPDARIPDGDAFLSAVEDMIDGRAVTTGPVTREILAAPPPPRGCRPDGRGRRRGARRAWLWAVPLVLFLLGAGTLGLVLGPSGGERSSGGGRPSDRPTAAAPTSAGIVLAAGNYVGRPADEVVGELTALGLTVDRHDDVTPDAAPGTVTGLDPTGVPLSPGDRVRLSAAVAPPAAPAAQDVDRGAPGTTAGRTEATAGQHTRSAPPAADRSPVPAPAATGGGPAGGAADEPATATQPGTASGTETAPGSAPNADPPSSGSPTGAEQGEATEGDPTTVEDGQATEGGPSDVEEDATTESSAPETTSPPQSTLPQTATDIEPGGAGG